MKDSKVVKLIALAYDEGHFEGRMKGYAEAESKYEDDLAEAEERASSIELDAYDRGYTQAQAEARDANNQETLAQAKSRAYEEGYAQGLSDGRHAEITAALDALPRLSVWFKPCGPSPEPPETYPPLIDKIKAIRAIREAYDRAEGYGLKEVKDLVEVVGYGCRFAAGEPLPQGKAVTLYLALQAAGFDPVLKS